MIRLADLDADGALDAVTPTAYVAGPLRDPVQLPGGADFNGDGMLDTVSLMTKHDSSWELDDINTYGRLYVRSGSDGQVLLDVGIRTPIPMSRVYAVGDVSGDGLDDVALRSNGELRVWFGQR